MKETALFLALLLVYVLTGGGYLIGFCAAACEPLPVRHHWQDWTVYG